MLEENIARRIRDIVNAEDEAFTRETKNKCTLILHEMAATGLAASGAAVNKLQLACEEQVMKNAHFVWTTIERVLRILHVKWRPGLAEDIQSEFATILNRTAGEANRIFREVVPKTAELSQIVNGVMITEYRARAKYNPEINLFCDALKEQSIDVSKGVWENERLEEGVKTDGGLLPQRESISSITSDDLLFTSQDEVLKNLEITPWAASDSCKDITNDTLGRQPYVQAFIDFVVTTKLSGPFTTAITGGWGEGKTIFLEWLEDALDKRGYKTVWFNAWQYDTRHSVWASLALAILKSHSSWWLKIKLWWFRAAESFSLVWFGLLGIILVILGVMSYSGAPHIYSAFPGLAAVILIVRTFWPFFGRSVINKARTAKGLDFERELGFQYQFISEFEHLVKELSSDDKPLVIFVDDLDRLSPRKTAEVFEAIHFLGENERCIFFVGLDLNAVSSSLSESYGKESTDFGRNFADKFLQLIFSLPSPNENQIEKYVSSLLHSTQDQGEIRTESVQRKLTPVRDVIADKNNIETENLVELFETSKGVNYIISQAIKWLPNNPRKIKRFINSFRITTFIALRLGYFKSDQRKELLPLAALLVTRQAYPGLMELATKPEGKETLMTLSAYLNGMKLDDYQTKVIYDNNLNIYLGERARLRGLIVHLVDIGDRFKEIVELVH